MEGLKMKLKNFIIGIVIIAITIFIISGINNIDNTYKKNCTVTSIKGDNIYITDESGYIFSFKGNGYEDGESVQVTFNDNHTANIKDDIIIKVIKK